MYIILLTSDIRFKALESQRKGHLFLSLATHWPLASPPQEAQGKNKRLTGIRWPLQASPPWQVMTGRSVFWPPEWRGSWRRKNLSRAKILYPELLFARVPLETRWFAWETDMWSEECSRREGTVFGDIFFTQIPLAAKKDSFWWQFFHRFCLRWPQNICLTAKHLPPSVSISFLISLNIFPGYALTCVPLKSFAWLPVNEICSSLLMYANLVSPQPPKHTLPV